MGNESASDADAAADAFVAAIDGNNDGVDEIVSSCGKIDFTEFVEAEAPVADNEIESSSPSGSSSWRCCCCCCCLMGCAGDQGEDSNVDEVDGDDANNRLDAGDEPNTLDDAVDGSVVVMEESRTTVAVTANWASLSAVHTNFEPPFTILPRRVFPYCPSFARFVPFRCHCRCSPSFCGRWPTPWTSNTWMCQTTCTRSASASDPS